MNTINNEMFIRRSHKAVLPSSGNAGTAPNPVHIVAMQKNIESYGFVFSPELMEAMNNRILADLTTFNEDMKDILPRLKGAHVRHEPMYPNFPRQVADASDTELYLNAFMHYFGAVLNLRIMPVYDKDNRSVLTDFSKLEVIDVGTNDEFDGIFTHLASSSQSISAADAVDLQWFFDNRSVDDLRNLLPASIPNKENLAKIAGLAFDKDKELFAEVLERAATATDILRIAAFLGCGDATLASYPPVRFPKFSKAHRRAFLSAMNSISSLSEDMLRNKELWKTFGEILHPGEYANRYPNTFAAFQAMRNDAKVETFASKVEKALSTGTITDAVYLLATRPGEFARRLDQLLRIADGDTEYICDQFEAIADQVSTPVLWQVLNHFQHRSNTTAPKDAVRTFFPKGNTSRLKSIPDELPALSSDASAEIVASCTFALHRIYAEKESLGKVYIDPDLKRFTIPSAVRSASKSLNTVGRGTRIPFTDEGVQRLFIWWTDGYERTDIDLSAVFLNEQFDMIGGVSYTNLRSNGVLHSGDITSAPDGASEYVDIPVKQVRENGIRYIAMSVNSYTRQPFADLPECFAGVMGRKEPQSGEVFDARTVDNIFDLTADSAIVMPMILDLETKEFIWTDVALKMNPYYVNNIHGNSNSTTELVKAMVSLKRPSLYELFFAHARSRGVQVDNRENADVVFHADNGRISENTETILADYL